MATWHTAASARDEWPDAPVDEDDGENILTSLLAGAREEVVAYAPASAWTPGVPPGADVITEGMRQAQLIVAQNTWNASRQPSGFYDSDQGVSSAWAPWRQHVRPRSVFGGPVG